MRHWLVAGAAIAVWAAISLAYGFAAMMAVGLAFGREGNSFHLLALLVAVIIWVIASVWGLGRLKDRLALTASRNAK